MINYLPQNILESRRALVIGAGKSGVSAVQLLLRLNKEVVITDLKEESEIRGTADKLRELGVRYFFGGHPIDLLECADFVVVSPGAPTNIPILECAYSNNIPVLGEFELASLFIKCPIIAVTGTNGKTTVATWVYHTIKNLGYNPTLAGNIDIPLSDIALLSEKYTHVVAEVSSYQLEYSKYFHPWIATVLNITPDHLSRHGNMENYAQIKNKIFENQRENDLAVLNYDDEWSRNMKVPPGVEVKYFSIVKPIEKGVWVDKLDKGGSIFSGIKMIGSVGKIPLPGKHNLSNALAVLAMLGSKLAVYERVLEGMSSFKGVPHRIEYVGEKDGVRFYNDSKSTNVDSLRVALESFQEPLILIAGGRGKGYGYESLRDLIRAKVKFMITMGEEAERLEKAFSDIVEVSRVGSMDEAVDLAWRKSFPGCVVLLSPGCASFDMYPNFEVRGNHYKECVKKIIGEVRDEK